uniref:Uncharacterized protein n=1 Tax=Tanacetum cinerariifolium TaxID=118510 RepID=A0A6L2K8Q6_TANCI|nr:hypothetical protein [Tanacetum cinerariifolium]
MVLVESVAAILEKACHFIDMRGMSVEQYQRKNEHQWIYLKGKFKVTIKAIAKEFLLDRKVLLLALPFQGPVIDTHQVIDGLGLSMVCCILRPNVHKNIKCFPLSVFCKVATLASSPTTNPFPEAKAYKTNSMD